MARTRKEETRGRKPLELGEVWKRNKNLHVKVSLKKKRVYELEDEIARLRRQLADIRSVLRRYIQSKNELAEVTDEARYWLDMEVSQYTGKLGIPAKTQR